MAGLFGGSKKVKGVGEAADDAFESIPNIFGPGFRSTTEVTPSGKNIQRFAETGAQADLTKRRAGIAQGLSPLAGQITGSLSDFLGNPGGGDATRNAHEQATYDRAFALLEPQLERRERNVRSNLVNTGNPIGTERAGFELDRLNADRNSTLNDLALGSVLSGLNAEGKSVANQSGRLGNFGQQLGQVGNIFSLMQADRPGMMAGSPLVSPGTVLGANSAAGQNKNNLLGSLIGAGTGIGSASILAGL